MKSRTYLMFVTICAWISNASTQNPLEQNKNISVIPEDRFLGNEDHNEFSNVLSVKFHLLSRKVPELLTRITLYEMGCPTKHCNISLIDIAEAIQLENYNKVDIADAIGKMNVSYRDAYNLLLLYSPTAASVDNLLTRAGTSFTDLYKSFVDSLSAPSDTIPKILNILNVSVFDFMNAQAYGNDTEKLQVLSTGNYSYENLQSVLNITNKTGIDVLRTIPLNTISKQLRNFDANDFTNFVKNTGVTSSKLDIFYNYLNITSIHFVAYPGFIQLWNDFDNFLNPEEVLATMLSETTLVTSNKAKSLTTFQTQHTDFVRNYSYFQVENINNPLVHYHVKNVTLNNPEYLSGDIAVIEVYNTYTGNTSELATSYNISRFLNCTYVTKLPYDEVHIEVFPSVELKISSLSVTKTNITVYNLGSPLFCDKKIVGIASQNSTTEIQFSTFMKKSGGTTKPPVPGAGSTIVGNLIYIKFLIAGLAVLLN